MLAQLDNLYLYDGDVLYIKCYSILNYLEYIC